MPTLIYLPNELVWRVDQSAEDVVKRLDAARLDGQRFVAFQAIEAGDPERHQVLVAWEHVLAVQPV